MIKYLWKKWIKEYNSDNKIRNLFWNTIKFPKNFYWFIREFCSFVKNGYPYEAIYNHHGYFRNHICKILNEYLKLHEGYPLGMTNEDWENIIKKMITALDKCYNPEFSTIEDEYDVKSKDEFFKLYNEYFFDLWD